MVLWRHFAPSAGWEIEILATDISTRVLERARKGICPIETARDVPPEYLKHFMLRGTGKQEGKMKAGAEIGFVIRFERLNLNDVTYPVTSLFDLILCRNVLIYFDQQHRCEILDRPAGASPARRFLSHRTLRKARGNDGKGCRCAPNNLRSSG